MGGKKNKVIVIESLLKSNTFLNYLKRLIKNTLYENDIAASSIKKDGSYFIIRLQKNNDIVFAMDLLSKISGISIIFIAKSMPIKYDTISQNALDVGNEVLLDHEKFSVTVTTSKKNMIEEDDKTLFFKKDLEFLITSELSSKSKGNKYVKDESEADKILFILIGSDDAYVSISLKKCTGIMPFNYLNEKVACPLYSEEYSFLSFISLMDNGFFPSPFIFFSNRIQLLKILKLFDIIIKRYPISSININLIDMSDTSLRISKAIIKDKDISYLINKSLTKLMLEETIITTLFKLKTKNDFVCLPFVSCVHPFWFIKSNMTMCFEFGKIPLTPLIYNFEYKNMLESFMNLNKPTTIQQSFESDNSFFELEKENFDVIYQRLSSMMKISATNKIIRKDLDMRKDDILDILDAV